MILPPNPYTFWLLRETQGPLSADEVARRDADMVWHNRAVTIALISSGAFLFTVFAAGILAIFVSAQ